MEATRLGPGDLLEYDTKHGVLVCRECRYAIQKSALQSHLLRHKIYRETRQRLLSSIAQLDILEPHEVSVPSPASPPIRSLPVLHGYCCTVAGCGSLCVSSKRMRRHHTEAHASGEPFSFRPAKLQTFFRGTKVRYFEVTPLPGEATAAATHEEDDGDRNENHHERAHDTDLVRPSPLQSTPAPAEAPRDSFRVNLDLETIMYFHHFTTTTSTTLPGPQLSQQSTTFWQAMVVPRALTASWLMCGLLAISAWHLAVLSDDAAARRAHHERLGQYLTEFSAAWEELERFERDMEDVKEAGQQIRWLLCCTRWTLSGSTLGLGAIPELAAPFEPQPLMSIARALAFTSHPDGVARIRHNGQGQTPAQATRILNMRASMPAGGNTPPMLLDHLCTLPFRMAEAFGRPNNAPDVLSTMSAIADLVECCETSFASDDVVATWRGMTTWLIKVSEHFDHMIALQNPAALVVLAHWAASLVKRAEKCGCWFLKGSSETTLLHITEQLAAQDNKVQELVQGIHGWDGFLTSRDT